MSGNYLSNHNMRGKKLQVAVLEKDRIFQLVAVKNICK